MGEVLEDRETNNQVLEHNEDSLLVTPSPENGKFKEIQLTENNQSKDNIRSALERYCFLARYK